MKISRPTTLTIDTSDAEVISEANYHAQCKTHIVLWNRLFYVESVDWKSDTSGVNGHIVLKQMIPFDGPYAPKPEKGENRPSCGAHP